MGYSVKVYKEQRHSKIKSAAVAFPSAAFCFQAVLSGVSHGVTFSAVFWKLFFLYMSTFVSSCAAWCLSQCNLDIQNCSKVSIVKLLTRFNNLDRSLYLWIVSLQICGNKNWPMGQPKRNALQLLLPVLKLSSDWQNSFVFVSRWSVLVSQNTTNYLLFV